MVKARWYYRQRQLYPSACFPSQQSSRELSRASSTACEHYLSYKKPTKRLLRRHFSSTLADDEYEQYRHLSEDVAKLIIRENERTRHYIDQTLQKEIAQEILEAYESAADDIPELGPTGQYEYFANESNGERQIHRTHVESGKKQLVFEINFHDFQLRAMSLSVKETYTAYLLLPVALPHQTILMIRRLDSGQEYALPTMGMIVSNIEWGPVQDDGSDSLLFATENDKGRPFAVYACCIYSDGTSSPPQLLYQNDDEAVMVDVQRTKGCKYVSTYASTKTSSEIHLVGNLQDKPILVRPREEGVVYHVDVGAKDDVFLLAHAAEFNHKTGLSEEMTLFETTVSELPLSSTFGIEHQCSNGEFMVFDMDVFADFLALYERSSVDGRHRIRLEMRLKTKHETDIVIPLLPGSGDCSMLSSGGNMYYESTYLRFRVQSPCSPGRAYSFDITAGQVQVLSSKALEEKSFVEKKVFATSADGTQVPMSIIYSDNDALETMDKNSRRPVVLIGYGAYGEPVVHGFDPTIVPLLSRGFVIAYAHTRGGGELGRAWYRAGRLDQKNRVIEDFLACAVTLIDALRITEPQMLTAKAFSAGGVTVAGAVNRQPSLFGSVVLTHPFLDVATSMSNKDLTLTEHEWNEWGNAQTDDIAAISISSYCPMSNVKPKDYPSMLLVGTMDDAKVPYWHPLTFCLKVRNALEAYKVMVPTATPETTKDISQRALLYVESSGGHQLHGTKLDVAAMEAAFIVEMHKNSVN